MTNNQEKSHSIKIKLKVANIIELSDKDFKTARIYMFKDSKEYKNVRVEKWKL